MGTDALPPPPPFLLLADGGGQTESTGDRGAAGAAPAGPDADAVSGAPAPLSLHDSGVGTGSGHSESDGSANANADTGQRPSWIVPAAATLATVGGVLLLAIVPLAMVLVWRRRNAMGRQEQDQHAHGFKDVKGSDEQQPAKGRSSRDDGLAERGTDPSGSTWERLSSATITGTADAGGLGAGSNKRWAFVNYLFSFGPRSLRSPDSNMAWRRIARARKQGTATGRGSHHSAGTATDTPSAMSAEYSNRNTGAAVSTVTDGALERKTAPVPQTSVLPELDAAAAAAKASRLWRSLDASRLLKPAESVVARSREMAASSGQLESSSTSRMLVLSRSCRIADTADMARGLGDHANHAQAAAMAPQHGTDSSAEDSAAALEHDEELWLECIIGRGGFGVVYLGTWRGLPVAVKTLVVHEALLGSEGRRRQRAVLEAAVSSALSHANVVQTYAFDVRRLGELPGMGRGRFAPPALEAVAEEEHPEGQEKPLEALASPSAHGTEADSVYQLLLIQAYCEGGSLWEGIGESRSCACYRMSTQKHGT